jgi:hypothetical protein
MKFSEACALKFTFRIIRGFLKAIAWSCALVLKVLTFKPAAYQGVRIICLLDAVNCLNEVQQQTVRCISWNKCVFGIGIFMERVMKKQTPHLFCFVWKLFFHVGGYVNSQDKPYPRAENPMIIHKEPSHYVKASAWYAFSVHWIKLGPHMYLYRVT